MHAERQIGRLYTKLLEGTRGLLLPPDAQGDERNIYWVYGIVLDPALGIEAEAVTKQLGAKVRVSGPATRACSV